MLRLSFSSLARVAGSLAAAWARVVACRIIRCPCGVCANLLILANNDATGGAPFMVMTSPGRGGPVEFNERAAPRVPPLLAARRSRALAQSTQRAVESRPRPPAPAT